MPIKTAAKKYMRVVKRKTERNKKVTGVFRSAIKKTRDAVGAGNGEEAKKWLTVAIKGLDKAAQKKVIKKNTAGRKKSRLNAAVRMLVKK